MQFEVEVEVTGHHYYLIDAKSQKDAEKKWGDDGFLFYDVCDTDIEHIGKPIIRRVE